MEWSVETKGVWKESGVYKEEKRREYRTELCKRRKEALGEILKEGRG